MLSQAILISDGQLGFANLISAVIFPLVFIAKSFHLLHETAAAMVVLLRPEDGASAFQLSNLQAFANEIKGETGLEVRIG
ncbi:MAG: hypothetical protein H8E29_13685 [Anaerolineales bacterium]|uniref:Uncharacterized protein n=1 Tax=Candidatus Desulfolinea nitratireducens TaxID=2841698 RepID=A0A8J6TGV2_9CHLR|nr:hypothetical protein [Candidatus Desulfolinea nitratireducens]